MASKPRLECHVAYLESLIEQLTSDVAGWEELAKSRLNRIVELENQIAQFAEGLI